MLAALSKGGLLRGSSEVAFEGILGVLLGILGVAT